NGRKGHTLEGMRSRLVALAALGMLALAPAPAHAATIDLEKTSATELESLMVQGKLTSFELMRAYIDRIAEVNQRGPSINAVRALNPDAIAEAKASDARRALGLAGPLEGLPVLVKDNIDVA